MDVTLQLDHFGERALGHFLRGRGESATGTLRRASLYYLADRDRARPAWRAPRFLDDARGTPMRISLDDEPWNALRSEALRQGVSADSLAGHALMYFLADVDRGWVTDATASATRSS